MFHDPSQVRDRVRDPMAGHLGSQNASWVIAEEGFVQKGGSSAVVSRRHRRVPHVPESQADELLVRQRAAPGTPCTASPSAARPPRCRVEGTACTHDN